jgi:hypothetical protein
MPDTPYPWKVGRHFGGHMWAVVDGLGTPVPGLHRLSEPVARQIVLWANAEDIQRRRGWHAQLIGSYAC